MAAHHARSNSLPSRQHPLIPEIDDQFCRLRSSEGASSSSTSLSSKLSGLQDLHDSVDKLLLLPLNQQALKKEQNEKLIDELLGGSLRLLDLCNMAKDALQETKESTQELQSIIRIRHGAELSLSSEVRKFLNSRKAVKKELHRAMERKCTSSTLIHKDEEIVCMLRDVQSITLAVFESMFCFISGPKSGNSSLVSKLMNSKKVSCEEADKLNQFASADAALNSLLMSQKMKKSDRTLEENAQNELQKLEMCIQDLEGVESLYRRLIKTRVPLLNILNH